MQFVEGKENGGISCMQGHLQDVFIRVAIWGPLKVFGVAHQKHNFQSYYAVVKYRLPEKYDNKDTKKGNNLC